MSSHLDFHWPQDDFKSPHQDVFTTAKTLVTEFINSTTRKNAITEATSTDIRVGMTEVAAQDPTTQISTQNILTTITDNISTTVENIQTTMSNNDAGTTPSGMQNSFNLLESINSNNTMITENNNSTALTELSGGNNTMVENITATDGMFEDFTTSVSNTVTETVNNVIVSSTEKIKNIINKTTNEITNNQTNLHESQEQMSLQNNYLIIYIIVSVLLAILILIFIGLFIFYKKKKCPQNSGDYYVTQLKDVSYSSGNTDDINVKL